jgi:geranyl-CoA carboxylase alpha subunit
MSFSKILVANRGEIAVRVLQTAKRLGYATVAVYSSADRDAIFVSHADEAVLLGPPPARESYLDIDRIIEAARRTGADAIHPGYGFLSENASFARACADHGITFIGPPASAIELMGNKRAAKQAVEAAGVPCVPGYRGSDQSDARLLAESQRIGFPVMVKAAAGGGGRGMRSVRTEADLTEAIRAARREAKSAFGDDELLLEKEIVKGRHVEVQVFGDAEDVIHLGERDCSIQRRHQKVIEESPSPAVDPELRQRMGEAAVQAARACGYRGAGTVEFLLDQERRFYFLEMNTRLQVEHPVTEMVTGVDLVEWQIAVAAGKPMPRREVSFEGHAIEARLYAEDPAHDFAPQTGRLIAWRVPEGVRVDSGVVEGDTVAPHYDPMLAKIVAHGATRDDARRKLAKALSDTTVFGVVTNKSLLRDVLLHPAFAEGSATTSFLAEHRFERGEPSGEELALGALAVYWETARQLVEDAGYLGWRTGGPVWSAIVLGEHELRVTAERGRYAIASQSGTVEVELLQASAGSFDAVIAGVRRHIRYAVEGARVWIDDGAAVRLHQNETHRPAKKEQEASGRVTAPHDGAVTKLFVAAGDAVEQSQLLLVIEAMKMEQQIRAGIAGTVSAIHVKAGDQVRTGQLLY